MEWLLTVIAVAVIYYFIKEAFFGKKVSYVDPSGKKKTEHLKRRQPRQILEFEKPDIEITPEIENALNRFENTSDNIFLTGKAGTGKSTLLRYFRSTTKKNYAVVAPTGIAALNVQGQTIHSFFGFGIDITPERIRYARADKLNMFRNLDALIIDEVSMVRADLLDCVDISLRKNRRNNLPFGGVQIIAIGDPYQLPPVVKTSEQKFFQTVYSSPHFFSAKSYQNANFSTLELTKIYRQSDAHFISILNNIRSGDLTQKDIDLLNSETNNKKFKDDAVKLVPTNALAKIINNSEMRKLPGEEREYRGHIIGDFNEYVIPTEMDLILKEGARVMLLNNDKRGRWVNGDIGNIISLEKNSVKVKFDDDTFDDVDLNEWDNIKFVFDEEKGKIVPEIVGRFIQLPIKLAWAMTIHKSQGKTYNNVHIDFGTGTFAPGQAYVALSRCISLEGLSFETPMVIDDVITDRSVKKFMGVTLNNVQNIEQKTTARAYRGFPNGTKVSKSDLNKLNSFINSPEKYATGTVKARGKVKNAQRTFDLIKDTLDQNTQDEFYNALKRYNTKLKYIIKKQTFQL